MAIEQLRSREITARLSRLFSFEPPHPQDEQNAGPCPPGLMKAPVAVHL